ncbi:hypothetical protein FOPE_10539 [Fonsecaea pedrosoi]|nr:hypothetical protein FOPE_10539 [Fonsecaea pedrosoi]
MGSLRLFITHRRRPKNTRTTASSGFLGYVCVCTVVALGDTVFRLTDQCSVKHDLVRYKALILSRWSTHFPSDRELWQDAADLEAREEDDISGLQGDDRSCLKDWLEVSQLVAFPPSSAKRSTPEFDPTVKAPDKSTKDGGKEKAEVGSTKWGPRVRLDTNVVENARSLINSVTEDVARVGRHVHTLAFWVNVLDFSGGEKMLERYRAVIPWGDVVA